MRNAGFDSANILHLLINCQTHEDALVGDDREHIEEAELVGSSFMRHHVVHRGRHFFFFSTGHQFDTAIGRFVQFDD